MKVAIVYDTQTVFIRNRYHRGADDNLTFIERHELSQWMCLCLFARSFSDV